MITIAVTAEGPDEPRVAVSPETVKKLVALGATVKVQSGAGLRSRFSDDMLKAQGGLIIRRDNDKQTAFILNGGSQGQRVAATAKAGPNQ